jgi:hypothetical protein
MGERRMFTRKITESDAFLDMPSSTQMLYFHLAMNADDDGFVNNPKKIQKMCGAADDDFKLLIAKSFVILFDSGIAVIKHWKMHNYIQSDRYKPSDYVEEKSMLGIKKNKAYTLDESKMEIRCIPDSVKKEKKRKESKKNEEDIEKRKLPYYPNDSLLEDAFQEFLLMRKKIKRPLATKQALTRMMNKIQRLSGGDNELAVKIINQSTDHCWQDVYELKKDSPYPNKQDQGKTDWNTV